MNERQWVTATNLISEVVMNRPLPLRTFDQIYMRAGDMVTQALRVGEWAAGSRLAFIGDGDGIALSVACLQQEGLIETGPTRIKVFDFDERIVNSVRRLSTKRRLHNVDAERYNCLEDFPAKAEFDRFYTNPPWGESNAGDSVIVFVRRGMEAVGHQGEGMIVIADDSELVWPREVLRNVQLYSITRGFYVASMERRLHSYHLPEAAHLRSCNLVIGPVPGAERVPDPADEQRRLGNFYGRSKEPKVRYVLDRSRPDHDRAPEQDYVFEEWERDV